MAGNCLNEKSLEEVLVEIGELKDKGKAINIKPTMLIVEPETLDHLVNHCKLQLGTVTGKKAKRLRKFLKLLSPS